MPDQICLRCSHRWRSIVPHPKSCPRCRSYEYRQAEDEARACYCYKCGYSWVSRRDPPRMCPRCKRYDYRDAVPHAKEIADDPSA